MLRSTPVQRAADLNRWLWWIASGIAIVLLSLHLAVRFWLVPQIPERRAEIEDALSAAIQRPVRLGEIRAGWSGLQPRVDIGSLTVLDRNGDPALVLPAIGAALSWRSVTAGTVVFSRLHTGGLELFLRRTPDGTVLLGDIPLNRGDDNRFLDWLQQQRGIDLERSVVHWDDALRDAPRLTLRDVSLRLRNRGQQHQFGLRATPPEPLGTPLDVRGEWRGDSVLRPETGRGRLYGQLQRVDLAALARWVNLPWGVRAGRGGLRLWLDLEGDRVAGITADARLEDLHAQLEGSASPLDVRALAGRIRLVNRHDRHALELRGLTLQTVDGVVAPDTTLSWEQTGEGAAAQHRVRIEHLVLGPLLQTAAAWPLPDDTRSLIERAAPRGELRAVEADWLGDWRQPTRYAVKGRFEGLGAAPVEGWPGFDRLSGTLEARDSGGRASLALEAAPVIWPANFRRAIPVRALQAQLDWHREGDGWRHALRSAQIDTGELQANLRGEWRPTARQLELDANVRHLDAAAVAHYLPESVGDGTRDWLMQAFPAGGVASGKASLRGDPAHFPYADGTGGRFDAHADLQVPVLAFNPDWPRLQAVEGRLRFANASLSAERAHARIGAALVEHVKLRIPDLDANDPQLEIAGKVAATFTETLDYIQASPVRGLIGGATDGMSGTGKAVLNLALRVPLDHSGDTTVKGEIALEASRFEPGPGRPPLTGLNGRLLFTERGVSSPGLTANLLGGTARATLSSQPGGIVRLEASGRARIASLAQQFPLRAWALASGESGWRGDIVFGPGGTRILIQSGLEGVGLDLPQPLAKSAPQSLPLRFVWQSGERGDRYDLDIGSQIHARVQTRSTPGAAGSAIEQALVGLGAVPLPAERGRGVVVAADLPQFFATQWLPVIDRFASGDDGASALPVQARIRAGRFEFEGQFLGETDLMVERTGGPWRWSVRGTDAEGQGQWDPAGNGSVVARLTRLSLGAPVDGVSPLPEADDDGAYPALDVEVGNFIRRGREFGQLRLRASQQGRDWRIDQLRLTAPEYRLEASGLWQAWRSRPLTDVRLELRTTDTGRYLERLGYGNVVRGAPATLKGELRWRGPPTDLDFGSLSGRFRLETGKGQFVKADPGAARLLGILSLQALPRRITLDFRDVFSDGLAFDSIESDLTVTDGIIQSEQFFIDGPAAKVRIRGSADLAHETQDLQVRVSPAMDAATIGALIANPIAGLAVFIVQQLLDDPLGKLITFGYRITGTWSDPVVTRQGAPEVTERQRPGGAATPGILPGGAP